MTSSDVFSFDVSGDARLQEALVVAPIATHFWVRTYFQTCAEIHRETLQRRARGNVDFRGNKGEKAVRVYGVNETPDGSREHWIAYQVLPQAKRITDERQFSDITLDIFSRSELAAQMQRDRAIKPRRAQKLAIPIELKSYGGFGQRNVSWGRAKNRPWPFIYRRDTGAVLIAKKSKRSGKLLLYERVRFRGRARRRLRVGKSGKVLKSQPRVWVDNLVPKWALVDLLVLKRSVLQFYETWDSQKPVFDRVYNRYVGNLERDIARGVVT